VVQKKTLHLAKIGLESWPLAMMREERPRPEPNRCLGAISVRPRPLQLSANLRIDLDQLLVGDGSKVRRLFPYVRQLAAVEMGCLLLILNGHAPQLVCHVFAGRNMRLLRTGRSELKEFFVGLHGAPAMHSRA